MQKKEKYVCVKWPLKFHSHAPNVNPVKRGILDDQALIVELSVFRSKKSIISEY